MLALSLLPYVNFFAHFSGMAAGTISGIAGLVDSIAVLLCQLSAHRSVFAVKEESGMVSFSHQVSHFLFGGGMAKIRCVGFGRKENQISRSAW
jgi:hypothetical protein